MPINFKGAARPRTDAGFKKAAELIGCEVAVVDAIVAVEASGSGFFSDGRPKILFERHVFWKHLPANQRSRAEREGLAWRSWKPGTYGTHSQQYPRLIAACNINETAALKACSWGLPQILGENHAAAGYASPQIMVQAFAESEDEQLAAMARFIGRNAAMRKAACSKDWKTFARLYNGPGYAKNKYDTKLAAAYAAARKVRERQAAQDPPRVPRVEEPAPAPAPVPVAPAPAVAEPMPAPAPTPIPTPVPTIPVREPGQSFWSWLVALLTGKAPL